jgi:hypothetical protein
MTESEAEDLPDTVNPSVIASLVNHQPLDKATLDHEIKKAMAKLGITPEVLIKRHKELLDYENPTINLKALELLYKMLGLLKEQVEHSGSVTVSQALKDARSRVLNYDPSQN